MPQINGLRCLLVVVALWACPWSLAAQDAPHPWNVGVELGFNGASGNTSFSILRTGAKANYLRTDKAEFEASALVRYGSSDEEVIADDAKFSLKLDLSPKGRWSPFLFADLARDGMRRLDARFNVGAGSKFTFWNGASGKASISAAALYDYENFAVDLGSGDPETESLGRWSMRTKVEKKLSAYSSFEQVVVYQPAFAHLGDYIFDMTNSVSTEVLSHVSLALEHQYLRDATPPPGVRRDDQRFTVVLKLTF